MSSILKETQYTVTRNDGSVYRVVKSYTWLSQTEIGDSEIRLPPVAVPAWVPIWDPTVWTGYPITDFEMLAISVEIVGGDTDTYADQFIYLQSTVNKGDGTLELHSHKIKVGQDFHIPNSAAYYNHGADVDSNASLDVIDALDVKNPETDTTIPDILVRLLMIDNT